MQCTRQTLSKYKSRKGPPYPARACYNVDPTMVVLGNDGLAYEIRVASNGVPRWVKVGSKRSPRKRSPRKRSPRKKSPRRKRSPRKRPPRRKKSLSRQSPSTMTRRQVISRLRYWRDRWEKASKKHQDLDDVRLREEPLTFLRKALRSYQSEESMRWLREYEE